MFINVAQLDYESRAELYWKLSEHRAVAGRDRFCNAYCLGDWWHVGETRLTMAAPGKVVPEEVLSWDRIIEHVGAPGWRAWEAD